jgi:hypothetical protein
MLDRVGSQTRRQVPLVAPLEVTAHNKPRAQSDCRWHREPSPTEPVAKQSVVPSALSGRQVMEPGQFCAFQSQGRVHSATPNAPPPKS